MQMTITPLPAPVRPRKALLILMYHHIGPFPDVTRQHHVYCDVNQFAAQMAYLDRSSLSVISMDRAIESLTGRAPLERRSVVLTFDDGFQNFHDFAWPILKSMISRPRCMPSPIISDCDRTGRICPPTVRA